MTLGQIGGVPILDYHRIVPAGGSALSGDRFAVHESEFRDHLKLLQDLKLTTVMPDDIADGRASASSVSLTFDDGYSSHYDVAFRLMLESGVRGTFFLITSRVGTGEFLDWTMAAEMARAGMHFGSHGHNHVVLTTLPAKQMEEELRISRQILEQRLSCAIEIMAVPYGFCDRRVVDAAWESGYRVVCTSRPWPAQRGKRVLSRVAVSIQTSMTEFSKLVQRDRSAYLRLSARDCALAVPRQIFLRLKPDLLGVRTAEGSL